MAPGKSPRSERENERSSSCLARRISTSAGDNCSSFVASPETAPVALSTDGKDSLSDAPLDGEPLGASSIRPASGAFAAAFVTALLRALLETAGNNAPQWRQKRESVVFSRPQVVQDRIETEAAEPLVSPVVAEEGVKEPDAIHDLR
jgi:hypothetical protein